MNVLPLNFLILTIIIISFYLDGQWEYLSTLSVIAIKFWAAITYFAVYLQATEMYPTCLRQTGLSIGIIGSNIVGIGGPYIAYLVSKYQFNLNFLLPLILFSVFFSLFILLKFYGFVFNICLSTILIRSPIAILHFLYHIC